MRASLDEAVREADEHGWLTLKEVFDPIAAELLAEIEKEEQAITRPA